MYKKADITENFSLTAFHNLYKNRFFWKGNVEIFSTRDKEVAYIG